MVHLTQQFGSRPQYPDHRNVPTQKIIKIYSVHVFQLIDP